MSSEIRSWVPLTCALIKQFFNKQILSILTKTAFPYTKIKK